MRNGEDENKNLIYVNNETLLEHIYIHKVMLKPFTEVALSSVHTQSQPMSAEYSLCFAEFVSSHSRLVF